MPHSSPAVAGSLIITMDSTASLTMKGSDVEAVSTRLTMSSSVTAQQTSPQSLSVVDEQAEWRKVLESKRKELESSPNKDSFHLAQFEEVQAFLLTLSRRYERKPASKCISKCRDSLRHVQSFTNAISSICQAQEASTIIWGGLLAIMQVPPPLLSSWI